MRPILIAREGLSTIVLIENGNDEDAWKGGGTRSEYRKHGIC